MNKALSDSQFADYERDGYVIARGFISEEELEPLFAAYREDPSFRGSLYGMVDAAGQPHPINIWIELADDMIGMIPRMARMVEATERCLGGRCYHWHSKFTNKPPGCAAQIDWHQDYASWYDDGVLFPDMLTVGIALEPTSRENGCLQVVPGSHRLGLMNYREEAVFAKRIEAAKEQLGLVFCEMDTGDAVFFHCNTLHGSASNESDRSRLMLFVSYNAASNSPVDGVQGLNEDGMFMGITPEERKFRPLQTLPDDVLEKRQYISAFGQTKFKQPVAAGDESSYTQAVPLK